MLRVSVILTDILIVFMMPIVSVLYGMAKRANSVKEFCVTQIS